MHSLDTYKLSFIVTDRTCEAEFFCFHSIARRIVGKPYESLLTAARTSQGPPADLAAIVSLKFSFAFNTNIATYSMTNRVFYILFVLKNHGRQSSVPSTMMSYPQQ